MKQEIFESEFVNFSGELTSFIYRLVANKQDAEDLVQDSYIKAISNLSSYQSEKASLKTWVFTIALNTAKNHLVKMKRWGENDLTICEKYHSASVKFRLRNNCRPFSNNGCKWLSDFKPASI